MYEALPLPRSLSELVRLRLAGLSEPAQRLDAARAIEERSSSSDSFPLRYSELAHHFEQAGALSEAIDCLELAADDALAKSAAEDTVRALKRAIALEERLPTRAPVHRRAGWHRRIADAHATFGRHVDGLRARTFANVSRVHVEAAHEAARRQCLVAAIAPLRAVVTSPYSPRRGVNSAPFCVNSTD